MREAGSPGSRYIAGNVCSRWINYMLKQQRENKDMNWFCMHRSKRDVGHRASIL